MRVLHFDCGMKLLRGPALHSEHLKYPTLLQQARSLHHPTPGPSTSRRCPSSPPASPTWRTFRMPTSCSSYTTSTAIMSLGFTATLSAHLSSSVAGCQSELHYRSCARLTSYVNELCSIIQRPWQGVYIIAQGMTVPPTCYLLHQLCDVIKHILKLLCYIVPTNVCKHMMLCQVVARGQARL